MKVVIVNAYDRHNAGDAALLNALIGQTVAAFPEADLRYASLEHPVHDPTYDGIRNLGSVRRWVGEETVGRVVRIARKTAVLTLAAMPGPLLSWVVRRGLGARWSEPIGEIRAVMDADVVVGLGGGYLNGATSLAGTLNVLFLLLPIWLATRFRRPVVLAPQSYGPFGTALQVLLVRRCLNRVNRIVVREDLSLAELITAGVRPDLVERGVDSAFVFGSPRSRSSSSATSAVPQVGITARQWLRGPDQESYERSLAAFVDWLEDSEGAFVTLIPQVTSHYQNDDDRLVSRRIASYCRSSPKVLDSELSHRELRDLYGNLDYLVGTRFHSVIFSLTVGTPALAIEYERKTSGIMKDLGLDEWVIPIHEVSAPRLRHDFLELKARRDTYLRVLHQSLPAYVGRAQEFSTVLRTSVA